MKQYLDLLQHVLDHGVYKMDRTGVGVYSYFQTQTRYDLSEGFPILTTKKMHLKSIIYELLWMLKGETNNKWLNEKGVTIWDEWADEETGDLGPVYGAQWRTWRGADGKTYDQISKALETIKKNPYDRRILVNAWKVDELDKMALPPCHVLFQFSVTNKKLSLGMYQRSADMFLGVPFNVSSYALLLLMFCYQTGYEPGEFIHTIGYNDIYTNHVDQVKQQLTRAPFRLPKIVLNPDVKSIFDYKYEDFSLVNYLSHPPIPAPIAV